VASTDRLQELARPLLAEVGLRLWDIETSGDVLRILVDREGGIDLDALTEASRAVSALLDVRDDLTPSGQYQLEVSSPGLERTLRTPEHYRSHLGTTVSVKTTVAVAGSRRHRGILTTAGEAVIELLPDTAPGGPATTIAYADIERTRTVLDWGPAPKPGSRPKAASTRSTPAGSAAATAGAPAQDPKDRSR
jgi:ribosome maturation factor RimP